MAVQEIMEFVENGHIKNSVNYPAIDAGVCSSASRITVCHKNIPNMLTQFTGAFSSKGINVTDMVSKSRGDWAYTILDVADKSDDSIVSTIGAIDGVVKVRIVK
jgi:D-3-phosphoglycerate dehydrogenase